MITNKELFPELDGAPPKFVEGDDVVTRGTLQSFATFSVDGIYRYALGRIWDPDRALLVCGMLNPSKANETILDPTVTRVVGFGKRDGFGGILVWNAAALVSTNPKALLDHPDPCGPRNYEAITNMVKGPMLAKVVVAWGKPPARKLHCLINNAELLACTRGVVWQFGESTKDGFPRHPLYLRGDTRIIRRKAL